MTLSIKKYVPPFVKNIYNQVRVWWVDRIYLSREKGINYNNLTPDDLCDHTETVVIRKSPKRIVRCTRCQVAFDVNRPSLDERTTHYGEGYFKETTRLKDTIFEERFPYFMSRAVCMWGVDAHAFTPPNNKFLDVGCGVGMMLKVMQFFDMDVTGIEQSEWAVEYCRKHLHIENVQCGTLTEAHYASDHFGMIALVHILEHLDDPVPILKEVFRVLAPGGIVYGEVPFSEKLKDYALYDHYWFYNEPALKYLLSCIGFRDILIKNGTYEPKMHNVPFLSFRAIKLAK